jgi:hypothetical protein
MGANVRALDLLDEPRLCEHLERLPVGVAQNQRAAGPSPVR